MKGPRRIVDLDGVPLDRWRIDERSILLWENKLWVKEKIGCCLCVEKEGPEFATLCHTDVHGVETFRCMDHGPLVAVNFSMKKIYTIRIGDVIREGTEEVEDVILLPEEMTLHARNELIGRLLDEAQSETAAEGVT